MKVSRKNLLLLAVLASIPLSESFAQEETDPQAAQTTPDRHRKVSPLKLKAPHRGYFLTEEQIEKLSSEARAEVEKLLIEKNEVSNLAELRNKFTVTLDYDETAEPKKQYHYMIGVVLVPEKEQSSDGVLIERVTEDSPALKSGLKNGDTILKVNETEISNIESLMDAIEASKGKELTLQVRRASDANVIDVVQVTPVKRPKETQPDPSATPYEIQLYNEWMTSPYGFGESSPGLSGNARLHTIYPGVVLNQNAPPLPENLSITITRQGTQPARITVKRDELTWELTQQELDKLPADVRPHVEQLLGGGNGWRYGLYQAPRTVNSKLVPMTVYPPNDKPLTPARADEQVADQLKLLQKQLEELQKSVEKLQAPE